MGCRYPSEADAQSLRAAVLLDELDFPGIGLPDPRTGHIIVELKTANAVRPHPLAPSRAVGAAGGALIGRRAPACAARRRGERLLLLAGPSPLRRAAS